MLHRPDTKTKHSTGKSKPKLVRERIFGVRDQSIMKHHQFENCSFYKVLYDKLIWAMLVCYIHVHNLIKIEISKMTVLRNSLVYDWQLIHSLVLVWSFQWCVLCLFLSRASIPWYCIRVYNATNYNILAAFFSIIKALLCKNSKRSQNSILESYNVLRRGYTYHQRKSPHSPQKTTDQKTMPFSCSFSLFCLLIWFCLPQNP